MLCRLSYSRSRVAFKCAQQRSSGANARFAHAAVAARVEKFARPGLEGRGLGFDGAESRNRTDDTSIFSAVLYRLSYLGIIAAQIPRAPASPLTCM